MACKHCNWTGIEIVPIFINNSTTQTQIRVCSKCQDTAAYSEFVRLKFSKACTDADVEKFLNLARYKQCIADAIMEGKVQPDVHICKLIDIRTRQVQIIEEEVA